MFGLRPYEAFLAVLETLAAAALLIRFSYTGLYKTYRFFFAYLMVMCVQGIAPFFVRFHTYAYGMFFFITEGVIMCLYAFIVLELYSLVLRDLPGIATVAGRFIRTAIAIAILISALLLSLERTPSNWITSFFSFERPIVSSLVFFVFLITVFLARYPIRLNRNVIYYTIGYAFYFTSKAAALLFRNTGHAEWDKLLSPALLAVSTACLIFWTFALKRQREQEALVFRRHWKGDEEQRLLQKLNAVNASLLRARK
jgi:hypothetical protein